MIANLKGRSEAIGKDYLIVGVGGIGFKVYVPTSFLETSGGIGRQVELFTHLRVRENELVLYGCGSEDELALFEMLLTVSGVGPKVALAMLSTMSPDSLRLAIARGDAVALARVPGIGPKMAKKIVFHLKDRVEVEFGPAAVPFLTEADAEVIAALTSLGYSVVEAQAALQSLPAEEMEIEERVRLALAYFARG
ncbi:MAG: Holliday junction branch migration protein RuvA [Anaerolineales bacterium]|nr:Holliday junction branch migration protein RuvA [Anaerolineales bacterium]